MDFFKGRWEGGGEGEEGICRLIGWWGSGSTDDDKSIIAVWVRIKGIK